MVLSWLSAREGDAKHRGWAHPIMACLIITLCSVTFTIKLCDVVMESLGQMEPQCKPQPVHGQLLALYAAFLFSSRVLTVGSFMLYEFTWCCNLAMVIASIAFLTGRRAVVGAVAIAVSIDQVLWYADLLGYALTRKFPVGVAKYLTWPETSLTKKITSTHHVWFLPYCIYVTGPIPLVAYPLSVAYIAVTDILCRWLTPFRVPAPKQHNDKKEAAMQYLNVNLAYELWRDIKVSWLQLSHPSAPIHLFRLVTLWTLLNGPPAALLLVLSRALASPCTSSEDTNRSST